MRARRALLAGAVIAVAWPAVASAHSIVYTNNDGRWGEVFAGLDGSKGPERVSLTQTPSGFHVYVDKTGITAHFGCHRINAGGGDDRIDLTDSRADPQPICSRGEDIVRVDPNDPPLPSSCEKRIEG